MNGALYRYLAEDHDRLDDLLRRAVAKSGMIDPEPYAEFRKGLLRHIAMEEKVLLPFIAQKQGGRPAAIAERIRLDHGALASLMVPPPTPAIIAMIRSIIQVHNVLEEQEGGMYNQFEQLAMSEAEELLERLKSTPEVPVLPHNNRPEVLEATRRAIARAGYEFKEMS